MSCFEHTMLEYNSLSTEGNQVLSVSTTILNLELLAVKMTEFRQSIYHRPTNIFIDTAPMELQSMLMSLFGFGFIFY